MPEAHNRQNKQNCSKNRPGRMIFCEIFLLNSVKNYDIMIQKFKPLKHSEFLTSVEKTECGGALENLARVPKVQSKIVCRFCPISQAKGQRIRQEKALFCFSLEPLIYSVVFSFSFFSLSFSKEVLWTHFPISYCLRSRQSTAS